MLQVIKGKFNNLSSRAIQNITGATIGLTTALASLQRTGCNANCRTCQSCTAAGIILIASPFLVQFQGRKQKIILGITVASLIGVGIFVWDMIL